MSGAEKNCGLPKKLPQRALLHRHQTKRRWSFYQGHQIRKGLSQFPGLTASWFHFPAKCWFRASNVTLLRCQIDVLEEGCADGSSISSAKKTRSLSTVAQTQGWERILSDLQLLWNGITFLPDNSDEFQRPNQPSHNDDSGVDYHLGVDSNLIRTWKIPPLGANPFNFLILNRASFSKEPFLTLQPTWILSVMILLNQKIN